MSDSIYSLRDYSIRRVKHLILLVFFATLSVPGKSQQMKDNAIVDLRGYVKECVVAEHHVDYGTHVYQFNKEGVLWKGKDMSNVKRANGYIVEYTLEDHYGILGGDVTYKIEYRNGKKIREVSASEVTSYSYNSDGYCIKKETTRSGKISTMTYVYLSFDNKGNWLKRERYFGGKQTIEERLITYYGEPKQYIMGFQEVINTLPQHCTILKEVNCEDRPDNGDGFYGRDNFKFYNFHKFKLIDSNADPNNYEWIDYQYGMVNEKGDSSIYERCFIRSMDRIDSEGNGEVVGIQLNKDNLNDYLPLSGLFHRKYSKKETELFMSIIENNSNNKAFENNPNYRNRYFTYDVIGCKIDLQIPVIKEITKEANSMSITLYLGGETKTYDLIIAKKIGYHSDFGAIYSVVKTIENVQSPYVLNKKILDKGDYEVFFTENINGEKRKSDNLSFSIY